MLVDVKGWLYAENGGARVVRMPTVRIRTLDRTGVLGLVWHATGGVGGPRFAECLAKRIQTYRRGVDRAASWNVLLAKDGTVYQSAPIIVGTWHVGRPGVIAGRHFPNINAGTIGVELENAGPLVRIGGRFYAWPYWKPGQKREPDPRCEVLAERAATQGSHAYDCFPDAQVASAIELVKALVPLHGWSRADVSYAHADFAAPVKTDPGLLWIADVLPRVLDGVFGAVAPIARAVPPAGPRREDSAVSSAVVRGEEITKVSAPPAPPKPPRPPRSPQALAPDEDITLVTAAPVATPPPSSQPAKDVAAVARPAPSGQRFASAIPAVPIAPVRVSPQQETTGARRMIRG